jgi:TRAP-type uncharacterized transport system fused permease subunit
MRNNPFPLANLVPFLPYLYFISYPVIMFLNQLNSDPSNSYLLLLPAIPFVIQLIRPFKYVDLLLGIITFALSCYMVLAYLADLFKITTYNTRALSFIIGGILFLAISFTMSILLFRNERCRQSARAAA